MIKIYQQRMATALTVAIQVLVIAGFVACIVVGPQDQSSPIASPDDETWNVGYRSGSISPAAYDVVVHQSGTWPVDPLPETTEIGSPGSGLISFPVHPGLPIAS